MSMDILTLALARKYTNDLANSLGAVKGAPCEIESIEDTGEASVVTFKWTGADGTVQTQQMTIPYGGDSNIYMHDEEPVDAPEGSLWIDTDEIGGNVTNVEELAKSIDVLSDELHPKSPNKQLVTDYDGNTTWEDRTHWQESRLDVVLPEVTIPKKAAYLNDYVYYTRNLQAGHTYNVICDGVEYQCSPVWNSILSSYTIGNASLGSFGDDTGEPFFINSQMNMMMTIIYFSTEGDHTISINEGTIESTHQLDEKFIPETIARKSEVEAIAEEIVKSINGLKPDANGNITLPIYNGEVSDA